MAIGKSKISDLNFDSFQNTIDKNIETNQTSDKFDSQLRAYIETGEKLDAARESMDAAKVSLNEASSTLQKAVQILQLKASQNLHQKFKLLPSVPKSQQMIGINFLSTEIV